MAEDDGAAGGAAVGGLEPGDEVFGSVGRGFGAFEVHAAVGVQVAQAGEAVDDAAQAVVAAQAVAPAVGGVAVHDGQEVLPVGAAQDFFHFVGQVAGLFEFPFGQQAGVHHEEVALAQGQGAGAQPVDEFGGVGGAQDGFQGVAGTRGADAGVLGQQVQVVVAQDGAGAQAQLADLTQGAQGVGAAVDQVAAEPERFGGGGTDFLQQLFQRLAAALQISKGQCHVEVPRVSVFAFVRVGCCLWRLWPRAGWAWCRPARQRPLLLPLRVRRRWQRLPVRRRRLRLWQ